MYVDSLLKQKGYTLVELAMAIAILGIIAGIGVFTLSGDTQKRAINTTGLRLVELLRRAQSEATLNRAYRGICFKQTGSIIYAQLYTPAVNATTKRPTNLDCDSSDTSLGTKVEFRDKVTLCATCDTNVGLNKSVFFDSTGFASLSTGVKSKYEICLIHTGMTAGTRAREVEVSIPTTIAYLKQGDPGEYSSVVANSGSCI